MDDSGFGSGRVGVGHPLKLGSREGNELGWYIPDAPETIIYNSDFNGGGKRWAEGFNLRALAVLVWQPQSVGAVACVVSLYGIARFVVTTRVR